MLSEMLMFVFIFAVLFFLFWLSLAICQLHPKSIFVRCLADMCYIYIVGCADILWALPRNVEEHTHVHCLRPNIDIRAQDEVAKILY